MTAEAIQKQEQLEKDIEELRARLEYAETQSIHPKDLEEIIRPKNPEPYDGTGSLQGLLTQHKAYPQFYRNKFSTHEARGMRAGSCLSGTALKLVEPVLGGKMETDSDNQDVETNNILETCDGF